MYEELRSLFPACVEVVACEWSRIPESTDVAPYLLDISQGFAECRRKQFLAGRLCALKALARLTTGAARVGYGPEREPVWPAGISGSISHAGGWAVAAVCASHERETLGVDIEIASRGVRDLWPLFLSGSEQGWVGDGVDPDTAVRRATAVFSAKETFYKWQYPRTGVRFDFLDVEVAMGSAGNTLTLRPVTEKVPRALQDRAYSIPFVFSKDYVLTALYQ